VHHAIIMAPSRDTLSAYLGIPSKDPEAIPPNPANDRQLALLYELGRRNMAGQWTDNRLEQAQHLRGIVYVAIRAIATAMESCKISVQERRQSQEGAEGDDEDWVPVKSSHPLAQLLTDPNPRDTCADWLSHWVTQLELTGTAHTAVAFNRFEEPAELWPMHTSQLTWMPWSPQYPFGAWRVIGWGWSQAGYGFGTGMGAIISAQDMLSFRYRHPELAWDGYSPLTAGGRHIDVLEAIDESRKSVMDQGTRLDGILSVTGLNDDEQARAIQAKFLEQNGGVRNHGKVAVMGADGEVKFLPISTSAKDIDFASGWTQMVKAVLALFGVPPSVAGLNDQASYAEHYAALQQFRDLKLQPMADSFSRFLSKHLARKFFPDEQLRIVLELPPINDPDQKRSNAAAQIGTLHTINEARSLFDLDPIDGGDVFASEYEAKKQQEMQPPPQPGAGGDNPLAALMGAGGGDATMGGGPTAGAPPQPDGPSPEGSVPRPDPAQTKALRRFLSRQLKALEMRV
jgi:HK97 family phage portal protein